MPLTNSVIIGLNEITSMVEDKGSLRDGEIAGIKRIFRKILGGGDRYDVEEIESWLENEGSWKSGRTRLRVVNMSHYVQSRYEQEARFRMVSDGGSCDC